MMACGFHSTPRGGMGQVELLTLTYPRGVERKPRGDKYSFADAIALVLVIEV